LLRDGLLGHRTARTFLPNAPELNPVEALWGNLETELANLYIDTIAETGYSHVRVSGE